MTISTTIITITIAVMIKTNYLNAFSCSNSVSTAGAKPILEFFWSNIVRKALMKGVPICQ